MAINAQELQGQWNKLKGQVKEKWGQLSDDDLSIQGGNVDQLVGKIQTKTGVARETIEKFLTELTSGGSGVVAKAAEAVSNLTQNASGIAQNAGEKLKDGYGQVSDQVREKYGQAEDLVRHNPGQSVAAAFGLGIVAGLIFGLVIRSK